MAPPERRGQQARKVLQGQLARLDHKDCRGMPALKALRESKDFQVRKACPVSMVSMGQTVHKGCPGLLEFRGRKGCKEALGQTERLGRRAFKASRACKEFKA